MTETELTRVIRRVLKTIGVYCWKQWQGPMSQPKGVSDIIGCWNGRFLAIEVKTPAGRVTDDQRKFLGRIRNHGGIAFVVARSVDDVIDGLDVRDRFLF
jgi:penicillin-binding protein-related factor A (putative recombinase)